MREKFVICAAATGAVILTTISTVLDIIIADRVNELLNLEALLYAAAALQCTALFVVIYYTFVFVTQRKDGEGRQPWFDPLLGAAFDAIALLITGVGIVCFTSKYGAGTSDDFRLSAVGLTAWTLSIFLHGIFFALVTNKTRKMADLTVPTVQVTNLGIEHPSQKELRSETRSSMYSKDTTLASRTCTPTSPQTHSLYSSTTKNSIRSKVGRHSAKSSFDVPPLPATDVSIVSTAFDRYDTSNMDSDIRNTIPSSSPAMNRSGLETIPGSRPTSSGDPMGEVLMQSPKFHDEIQRTPEKSKNSSKNSTPSAKNSSPPNFSRPTSRNKHQATLSSSSPPVPLRSARPSASMTDLIHPLFRPDSPSPPQILTAGTMVTASPLANQPITPKTLSRLRSDSELRNRPSLPTLPNKPVPSTPTSEMKATGQWRVMPQIESPPPSGLRQRSKSHASMTQYPNIADSTSVSLTKAETCSDPEIGVPLAQTMTNVTTNTSADAETTNIGSPGPSIIEEDELPPILPGFILSAGSRMSLVGYGKRKSVKRNRGSVS